MKHVSTLALIASSLFACIAAAETIVHTMVTYPVSETHSPEYSIHPIGGYSLSDIRNGEIAFTKVNPELFRIESASLKIEGNMIAAAWTSFLLKKDEAEMDLGASVHFRIRAGNDIFDAKNCHATRYTKESAAVTQLLDTQIPVEPSWFYGFCPSRCEELGHLVRFETLIAVTANGRPYQTVPPPSLLVFYTPIKITVTLELEALESYQESDLPSGVNPTPGDELLADAIEVDDYADAPLETNGKAIVPVVEGSLEEESVKLQWPGYSFGWKLQVSTDLKNWADTPEVLVTGDGASLCATIPMTSDRLFFQLVK